VKSAISVRLAIVLGHFILRDDRLDSERDDVFSIGMDHSRDRTLITVLRLVVTHTASLSLSRKS
jgi:hypothetical protein